MAPNLESPAPATAGDPGQRRRKTVAVLIDYLDHLRGGYEGQLRSGFERASRDHDLNLLLVSGRALDDPDPGNRAHNGIYDLVGPARVDGVVLVSPGLASFSGVEGLTRLCRKLAPLPLCSLGSAVPGVPSVVIDQRPGMVAMIEHLITDHGRRRLAFVGGPAQNPDSELRFRILREALARHGLPLDPRLVGSSLFTMETGAAAIAAIVERAAEFDAVIAANDAVALGVIDHLKSRSVRVPRDVSVTGFDDVSVARYASPPLSTVRQPLAEAAATALSLVAEQLEGRLPTALSSLPVQAVTRRSCGCELHGMARVPAVEDGAAEDPARFVLANSAQLAARLESRVRMPEGVPDDWSSRLVVALQSELDGGSDAFLGLLESLIDRFGWQNELYDELQTVVTVLRQELARLRSLTLEDLWHSARRLIAAASTRSQTQQRLGVEMVYFHMLRAGEQLSAALDGLALKQILAKELPTLRARSAFISVYAGRDQRELAPLFCMRQGKVFDSTVSVFPAAELMPADAELPDRTTLFVLPLTFESEQLGVAVFEFDGDVTVHEMLREQISVALKTSALHAEIVHRTALHERSVQERLATAERMQSLSLLAGGVAHDLNNALGPLVALPDVILQSLNRSARDAPEDAELRTDVATIKLAAQRAAQTIKDLLTLGRQGRVNKEPIELSAAVVSAMAVERLRSAARGAEVRLNLELSSEPLVIRGSESHVVRAVSNLLHNALEAIDGPGSVMVKTLRAQLTEPLMGYEVIEPGDYAAVSISDTGKGISQADLGRIFEPFFSRKRAADAHGSGLGLAIVHGVVKEHEGFVNVESRAGAGTVFTLYFRRSSEALRPREGTSCAPGGSASILVVDDDPVQLRTARRVLGALGYRVTTAQGGSRAYEQLAVAGGKSPYDLVILDMLLNEEHDGLQLFERIQALFPGQRGILASGHAPPERERLAVSRGLTWLAKPYSADALARAVHAALAGAAPRVSHFPSGATMPENGVAPRSADVEPRPTPSQRRRA